MTNRSEEDSLLLAPPASDAEPERVPSVVQRTLWPVSVYEPVVKVRLRALETRLKFRQ